MTDNPVVDVAKEQRQQQDSDIYTLSTGIQVRLRPVSLSLILEVQSRFEYPDPPTVHIASKGVDEPNYDDPQWKALCNDVDSKRGQAALDAYAMFGLELVDDKWKETDGWIKKLGRLGIEFDVDDEDEREFHYKKFVAIGGQEDLQLIQTQAITQEGVKRQEASFRGNKKRS